MSTNIVTEHWSIDKTDRNNLICMVFYISRGWVLTVLLYWYNPSQILTWTTCVFHNKTSQGAFLYIDCFVRQSIGLIGLGIWLVAFTGCLANMLYVGHELGRILLQWLRYVTWNNSVHCSVSIPVAPKNLFRHNPFHKKSPMYSLQILY